jgi:capsular exopolysaccharide synthesis family protein
MTLHEYAAALARHWVVILVAALVGGGAAFLYSRSLDPLYRASASVIAIPERGENASDLVQGSLYVQNLVQSYAVLGSSPYVLDKAAVALGRDPATSRLAQQVNVDTPLNTVVIEISVVDGNPQLAKDAANAIAAELGKAVEQLSPQGTNQTPAVRLTTISPAALPAAPISPNTKLNTALGLLAGLALGVLYAVGRSLFGKRVVDRDSVMEDLQTPLLGEVFQADRGLDVPTSIALQPTGSVAESFRVLTANLGLAHVDGPLKVVLVTSGSPGEGKSSVSVGLAMTLAESEDRVLVLDGDLRMPSVARLTQLEGAVGVTSVLLGDVTMSEAAQQWGPPRLDIMASGQIPPNPGHVLASARFRMLLDRARAAYSFIVIDSPPVLHLSDALWLAPLVDGIIVVARAGESTTKDLAATLKRVENTRTPVVGVVLNGVEQGERNAYYAESARVGPSRLAVLGQRVRSSVGSSS